MHFLFLLRMCSHICSNCLSLFLQQIMKDRWINAGFDDDELKPYTEPELDITDQKRIGKADVTINIVTAFLLVCFSLFEGWIASSLKFFLSQFSDFQACHIHCSIIKRKKYTPPPSPLLL